MGPPLGANDGQSHSRKRRLAHDPTPSLTALLMESNYPETNGVQLAPITERQSSVAQSESTPFPTKCSRLSETPTLPTQNGPCCSCACSETVFMRRDVNGWTDIQLADWLTKCVKLLDNNPMILTVDPTDMRTLLYSSWKELVMLHMAQNNFDFEVIKLSQNRNFVCQHSNKEKEKRRTVRSEMTIPSIKHVEQLKFTLGKLCQMRLDEKEYALLRLLMLLNTDLRDLKNSSAVEKASEHIHTLLMEYENVCYPAEPLRLSHMLLHLPGVRGFPTVIFEKLFFRQLMGDTSVESVLRELIES